MAPPTITEDHYSTLEVDQSATLELVTRSYRRLALKLHPDRGGSTQAFQLLGLAYETLNDEDKRRAYDQTYSSIGRSRKPRQGTQTLRPPPDPASQSDTVSDDDLLAALRKENEVRGAQWRMKRESSMSPMIALQRSIRVLEQEIKDLGDAAVAKAAREVRKRNQTAIELLSAVSIEDDKGEKARRRRQEIKIQRRDEIEAKEWELGLQEAQLQLQEKALNLAKEAFDAANLINDRKIRAIEARVHDRKAQEQRERETERREREKFQKLIRQAKEAQEAARKRQTEMEESRAAMRAQKPEAQETRGYA